MACQRTFEPRGSQFQFTTLDTSTPSACQRTFEPRGSQFQFATLDASTPLACQRNPGLTAQTPLA
ncbi:MAG: hypothetical protein V2A79_08140 [Planctomycetota bacterium]